MNSTRKGSEKNMLVIYSALTRSVQPLKRVSVPSVITRSGRVDVWKSFRTVGQNCADNLEVNNICAVKHQRLVRRLCLRTLEDFDKLKNSNISHSRRMSLTLREIQNSRAKIKFLKNSGGLEEVSIHKNTMKHTLRQ